MKSVINKLDPDYNIEDHLIPLLQDIFYSNHGNPKKIAENLYSSAYGFMNLIHSAPDDLRELSEQLKRGRLTISIDYKGLDSAISRFERTSNRIVISIIAAALLIGSSLIIAALIMMSKTIIPEINGINIGFIGLILAAVLGIFLFFSIIFRKS